MHQRLNSLKLILIILVLQNVSLKAQVFRSNNAEIGIDEQLGKNIPLDLTFCNENNDSITLRKIIDKPTVLSFVYFDCPGLCSSLQQGISDVVDRSDLQIGKDYKVITISFNYHDVPLKARMKKQNFVKSSDSLRSENWQYLTGDSANINSILKSVGYKIKMAGNDFVHPSGIVVVSSEGKITRYLYGLTFLPLDFKMSIIEAQKGETKASIHRVLQFCFAYDPAGKRYTLEITKIAGTIILFFSLVLIVFLMLRSRKKVQKK
jgi:protein SCO1/2